MLSRILKGKKRFAQPDPSARRQAVEELSAAKAEALQKELLALAGSDPDPQVRTACIAKLVSADAVAGLLDTPGSAESAARRIIELTGEDTGNELVRHPLVAKLRLLQMTPSQAQPALQQIDDVELLIDLSIRAPRDLRDVILQRLQTTSALTNLSTDKPAKAWSASEPRVARPATRGLDSWRWPRHSSDICASTSTPVRNNGAMDCCANSNRPLPGSKHLPSNCVTLVKLSNP